MSKFWICIFLFWTTSIDYVPVLHEGRYCPLGALPKELVDLQKLPLLPSKTDDNWLPISSIEKGNPTPYPDRVIAKIREASNSQMLAVALMEGYRTIAKTSYKKAAGKELFYPSERQLAAELFLYHLPFKWIAIGGYLLAALCFIFHRKRLGWSLLLPTFILHTTVLALRCWIQSRPPVSTMSETILFVPWITLSVGLGLKKRQWVLIGALFASAFLLFFLPSHHKLENLQAVLDSQYWLFIHVMVVVASYGIFFLAGVCGHIYLIQQLRSRDRRNPKLEKTLIQTMYFGTALLMLGTFLGGVWAAQSWGRFWDWDPKESWAFISCGVYLVWIHAYRFKKIGVYGLAIGSIVGLAAITFTWYGVNYLLAVGLHSYGFSSGGKLLYFLYLLGEIGFLVTVPILKNFLYKNYVMEKKDQRR